VIGMIRAFVHKMRGATKSPPGVSAAEVLWSWIGSFLGIAAVGALNERLIDSTGLFMIIGSFGASAVLIYGAVKSPLAQPRNLLGGHVLSALVGVASYQLFSPDLWLAGAAAVATAIALMHATRTLHPPGGATALIAVIGGEQVHALGYLYAVVPAGAGALIMLAIALVVNNIPKGRRYPEFWY
jgi:CBS-domain-containing membrane protein